MDSIEGELFTSNGDTEFSDSSSIGDRPKFREDEARHELRLLVQKELRAVSYVRALVFTLLVVACASSATTTYFVVKQNDDKNFVREYTTIASSIGDLFLGALSTNLQSARAQSIAISTQAEQGNRGRNITVPNFENNVRTSRYLSKLDSIAWSPFLRTDKERYEFEAYAAASDSEEDHFMCNICGDPDMAVGTPNSEVTVPGFGTFTCGNIQTFLLTESLTEEECIFGQLFTRDACDCIPRNQTDFTPGSDSASLRSLEDGIFRIEEGNIIDDPGPGPYSPVWQVSPAISGRATLYNICSEESNKKALDSMLDTGTPVASRWSTRAEVAGYALIDHDAEDSSGAIFTPVFDAFDSDLIIGSIIQSFGLDLFIAAGFPKDSESFVLVYDNSCGQSFTYQILGRASVHLIGRGDLHDPNYDDMIHQTEYSNFHELVQLSALRTRNTSISDDDLCAFKIRIYPSEELERTYETTQPLFATLLVVLVFIFTTSLFLIYDYYVAKLQRKVMENAARTNKIISSLFPAGVRDRLLGFEGNLERHQQPAKIRLQNFLASPLAHTDPTSPLKDAEPIADLFLNTTVMFANIEGFTAWSSEREPAQVFMLLESVYQTFDKIALNLGVFKVESIGDSYVAVSGLPEPRKGHAVVMAKFAHACMLEINSLTKILEASLGPGTAELAMRFGLHSGPVLAGVLRGEKAHFQLFGDTMNTASRIETSGEVSKIHASRSTVELLEMAGKGHWVMKRKDTVMLKGKGLMETYWITPVSRHKSGASSIQSDWMPVIPLSMEAETCNSMLSVACKYEQLVEWNTDLLLQQLQKVVSRRRTNSRKQPKRRGSSVDVGNQGQRCYERKPSVMDEVTDVMTLPRFDNVVDNKANLLDLGEEVRQQLRSFVNRIASLYRDVPFHNFEHASHVSMSASKLLKRIIAPESVNYQKNSCTRKGAKEAAKQVERAIHDCTFGISSDPLLQLSIIFATLIHDVDHTGIANKHLVRLDTELARRFDGKCVAEQHSVVLAWNILMDYQFDALRACIYESPEEGARFRQLVVNAVIATDIADKELQTLRKNRWNKAFQDSGKNEPKTEDISLADIDRKATIVLEHIIQASDVAHTMQHWKVYQRWNEQLFDEMYLAYISGHSDEDPVPGWYKGELGFFDFYIIPLARKLEKCGIFGVSSDEYLNYALENRSEWEIKGEEIVKRMLEKVEQIYTPEVVSSLRLEDVSIV